MAQFFDLFPKVPYLINKNDSVQNSYQFPLNILVRIGVLSDVLDNIFYYFEHTVKDHETPEILADKFYRDPEAHWLILLTNKIYDAQFEWPLDQSSFEKYILDKYGSIAFAKTNPYRYERIREIKNNLTGEITYDKYQITYDDWADLTGAPAETPSTTTYTFTDRLTNRVTTYDITDTEINISPGAQSIYDWEFDQNEKKRRIKIIKDEYYLSIKTELETILSTARGNFREPGIRNLI